MSGGFADFISLVGGGSKPVVHVHKDTKVAHHTEKAKVHADKVAGHKEDHAKHEASTTKAAAELAALREQAKQHVASGGKGNEAHQKIKTAIAQKSLEHDRHTANAEKSKRDADFHEQHAKNHAAIAHAHEHGTAEDIHKAEKEKRQHEDAHVAEHGTKEEKKVHVQKRLDETTRIITNGSAEEKLAHSKLIIDQQNDHNAKVFSGQTTHLSGALQADNLALEALHKSMSRKDKKAMAEHATTSREKSVEDGFQMIKDRSKANEINNAKAAEERAVKKAEEEAEQSRADLVLARMEARSKADAARKAERAAARAEKQALEAQA
jgi:hypothetical protein